MIIIITISPSPLSSSLVADPAKRLKMKSVRDLWDMYSPRNKMAFMQASQQAVAAAAGLSVMMLYHHRFCRIDIDDYDSIDIITFILSCILVVNDVYKVLLFSITIQRSMLMKFPCIFRIMTMIIVNNLDDYISTFRIASIFCFCMM